MARRKMKIPKDKLIKGLRKALANPKTPRQFIPSLKKRLARLSLILAAAGLLHPVSSSAQTPVIIQPTQQTLALAGTACTGVAQNFIVNNRNQAQHYATITPSGVTLMQMAILGQDNSGNLTPISDTIQPAVTGNGSATVTGTGYYPIINVTVLCTGGTFTLTYSGTSAASNLNSGGYLTAQIDKTLFGSNASQGSLLVAPAAVTPFGSSQGRIFFRYNTAAVSSSTFTVNCGSSGATVGVLVGWTFNLAAVTTTQQFLVPAAECPIFTAAYISGGASANTFTADYIFDPPGVNSLASSAANLSAAINEGVPLAEKGARWSVVSAPAVSVQASASKAVGAAGVRHVADCVTISAGASTAPAATQLTINLRDGATGAGTIIWSTEITAAATATNHGNVAFCGLNLIGTAATAMTLEFAALLTNEFESATLTGYDVQ